MWRALLITLLGSSCAYPPLGPDGLPEDDSDAAFDIGDGGRDAGDAGPDAGARDAGPPSASDVTAACLGAQWECGPGQLSVRGVTQAVECGPCGLKHECISHHCRCAVAEVTGRLASPAKNFADEPPSLAVGADTVYAVQGISAPTVYEFVLAGGKDPTWSEAALSPDGTAPVSRPSIAVLGDAHRVIIATDPEVGLRQTLLSNRTYMPAQTIVGAGARPGSRGEVAKGPGTSRQFALATGSGANCRLETASFASSLLDDSHVNQGAVSDDRTAFGFHLARRPDGTLRIAVSPATGGALEVARPDTTSFTFEAVASGTPRFAGPRLAYAPDGTGWLLARNVTDGSLGLFWRVNNEMLGWMASPVALAAPVEAGESYDLAADATGLLHGVSVSGGQVVYGIADPKTATLRTFALGAGKYPRVVIVGDSTAVVVFRETQPDGLRVFEFCR